MKVKLCKFACVLSLAGVLAACGPTPYQPLGWNGGFSGLRLNKNTYKVSFEGNGSTSKGQVQNLLLRRCADVTLQSGYKFFVIKSKAAGDDRSVYQSPTTVTTNGAQKSKSHKFAGNKHQKAQYSKTKTISPGQTFVTNQYHTTVMIHMMNNKAKHAYNARIISAQFVQPAHK